MKMSFYDVATKKKFMTDKYKTVVKAGRRYAIAIGPKGNQCWRILGAAK
jgi:hypothetical protein